MLWLYLLIALSLVIFIVGYWYFCVRKRKLSKYGLVKSPGH